MAATKKKTTADPEGRFKDFGEVLLASDLEPISFRIAGETFHCRPAVSTKKMRDFVSQNEEATGAQAADLVFDFYDYVIVADDKERWDALLEDSDRIVTISDLGEILSWLIEQYTSRPTQQS